MLEAILNRYSYHPHGTIGELHIKEHSFYTAERPWLDNQKSISCIPTGEYKVKAYSSQKFGELSRSKKYQTEHIFYSMLGIIQ